MHFPFYLPLGPLHLPAHLIFEALAYFVGFRIYLHLRRTRGDVVHEDIRWWVITAAALGAAAGSKLLSVLEEPSYLITHWREPFVLLNGKTIVGGLIGGWIAVEFCKKKLGERERTGDLFVLPLCIGIAIGRVGCFLTGPGDHTFGAASSLPWAMDFGDGARRHPLPLYEIVFLLALSALLWRVLNRPHANGDVFKMFMCTYMGWRFATEFLKDREPLVLGITAIQWACVGVILFYLPDIWRWLRRRDPKLAVATGD
ncbi:prolipoprotein diacylglyceryl transferase [Candidatus Koribacter versatilis Ellin345]|uniref:Prolipoprotein diacylglyceryl transferase n=1 Tax=Koribacter versatilis (strain Ellin345) TaxID=204669 RepID=Q1IPR4_KORVE|nr:prolipoprotein diacylglyceryl transferase family protein [Candidatus Koribacter versatilis]ABF41136.1 prolipoprotein diacylglyceryl transferase [Candidatus Koribacter versatilis Ellin345]